MTSARYKLPGKLLVSTGWFQFIPSKNEHHVVTHKCSNNEPKKTPVFFVFQLPAKKLPGMFCVFFRGMWCVFSTLRIATSWTPQPAVHCLRLRRIELQQNGHEHIQDPPSNEFCYKKVNRTHLSQAAFLWQNVPRGGFFNQNPSFLTETGRKILGVHRFEYAPKKVTKWHGYLDIWTRFHLEDFAVPGLQFKYHRLPTLRFGAHDLKKMNAWVPGCPRLYFWQVPCVDFWSCILETCFGLVFPIGYLWYFMTMFQKKQRYVLKFHTQLAHQPHFLAVFGWFFLPFRLWQLDVFGVEVQWPGVALTQKDALRDLVLADGG